MSLYVRESGRPHYFDKSKLEQAQRFADASAAMLSLSLLTYSHVCIPVLRFDRRWWVYMREDRLMRGKYEGFDENWFGIEWNDEN